MTNNIENNETLRNETEAAGYLKISRRTLSRLRKAGKIRYYLIGGKLIRYSQDMLNDYLANSQMQENSILTKSQEGL